MNSILKDISISTYLRHLEWLLDFCRKEKRKKRRKKVEGNHIADELSPQTRVYSICYADSIRLCDTMRSMESYFKRCSNQHYRDAEYASGYHALYLHAKRWTSVWFYRALTQIRRRSKLTPGIIDSSRLVNARFIKLKIKSLCCQYAHVSCICFFFRDNSC